MSKRNIVIDCIVKIFFFSIGSIFYKSRLGIKKQIMMIYEYSLNKKVFNVAYEYSTDEAIISRFHKKTKRLLIEFLFE